MPDVSHPLRRSRTNRQIAGVVGGLAEYFHVDATLLRVIYVVGSIVSAAFPGMLVYVLLWLVIPEDDHGPSASSPTTQ
jgi:phage shock protein C